MSSNSLRNGILNSDAGKMVQRELDHHSKKNGSNGCLIVKPAAKWVEEAAKRPIPRKLFDVFWYENEVCIFFSDTNLGKTILAFQISDSISKGEPIPGFELETGPMRVLYLDFELSDKQIEKRYSNNYKDHYQFSQNFLRAELNPNADLPKGQKSFEDFLVQTLEGYVEKEQPKVLVVDNITYLNEDNEKSKEALPLMKKLKLLAQTYGISILVLAHTPKRDDAKVLTKNDLAGSKMLINFCDSSFALGGSNLHPSYRYLKQIKMRNTECVYHTQNVAICQIQVRESFLGFHFIMTDDEREHIKSVNQPKEDRNDQIIELKNEGLSNVAIGERLGVSEGTVRYVINNSKA